MYIEADEWLDGILYSLFAFDGKTAVENLMPLVAYVGRAPTDKIIKQLVNHPLFLLPGKTGNVFTANDAIQWEQAKSMILRTAGRYRDVVESMDNALSIASSVSPEEENKLLKNICLVSRGHAKALLGEMKEAKRDYVQAITGLKSIGEEQKLTQLLDVFISSLLNPQHFTVDILSTIIELIEECGVDYFNREVESLSKDSIRLLPDLIIYRFSNESWNEKTINKSVNRLHSVSKKAHAAGLNEFALICLDGASFLLMNKADKVQRALELYEEALALEQKSVDELTFWYLRARCLVSFADGLYKLKREQEAHSNYIKALKAYNHLRVLDKRNKLGLDKEFLVVHVRRRIAEIDRKFGKLKYSIRHLRKALQIIGLGVRNNSLYYGCILPDLATALAMNGETFQAIKILDLAAFIGVSQSLSLIKTNLCGWAALQMLEYDPNSGHSTLRISAKSIGAIDLNADRDELGEKMSPYWPAMAAYNLSAAWIPYNKNKSRMWFRRAESMRKSDKQAFWAVRIGLCFISAVGFRELELALFFARLLFKEKWKSTTEKKQDLKKQWTAHLGLTIGLANSCFAPEENPTAAIEIFDLATKAVENAIEDSNERKYWRFEIQKSRHYFRYRHSI